MVVPLSGGIHSHFVGASFSSVLPPPTMDFEAVGNYIFLTGVLCPFIGSHNILTEDCRTGLSESQIPLLSIVLLRNHFEAFSMKRLCLHCRMLSDFRKDL